MDCLKLPGTIDSLRDIADFVMNAADQAALEKKRAYRLRLAVDEIATNVVTHGYDESGKKGDIEIRSDIDDRTLTIILLDSAIAYNPFDQPQPDDLDAPLEERQMGGLGVFLAVRNVDDFKYEYVDGQNVNTFIVNLDRDS